MKKKQKKFTNIPKKYLDDLEYDYYKAKFDRRYYNKTIKKIFDVLAFLETRVQLNSEDILHENINYSVKRVHDAYTNEGHPELCHAVEDLSELLEAYNNPKKYYRQLGKQNTFVKEE